MKPDIPERTFEFARRVVKLSQVLDEKPGVSRVLANQLLRSGTSIGVNVEEGQASQSEADFIAPLICAAMRCYRITHKTLICATTIDNMASTGAVFLGVGVI